ncbi:PaaI family thioesterase [Nocardioides stalactiti]|uniref:PaaI family thioesterase n=1 Tax=Nocardioides stalactiti TaxID=2755356 RepID=UPI0016025D62|nr:PaaI family thioesterase [Nocardioides stalactiti]
MTALTEMSGLEQLRMMSGFSADVPFIGNLLGMELVEIEHGEVAFALTTRPDFANPMGNVHGGICATLLDSVMGCAVHTTLEPGESYATVDITVNYTGSVSTAGQRLTATGRTIHVGGRIATAEGKVVDEDGRLVAHGTSTCLVNRR